jgi:hypothetical protein
VHVVEGALVRQPGRERRGALEAHEVPADVRDLQLAGVQRLDASGQQAQAGRATELHGVVEQHLHPEADPENGNARLEAFADELVEAQVTQVSHRPRKRSHPGHDEAVARAQLPVVVRDRRAGADVLEGLLHRTAVAHAVVDDSDARTRSARRAHVSVPLVLGTPVSVGSSCAAARSARANALKAGLDHVMGVRAGVDAQVQGQLGRHRDGPEELLGLLVVEARDRARRQLGHERAIRPARDVDRRRRERLVHRHDGVAVARDPAPVAERSVKRLAEADARVLDGVVRARV